MELEVEKKEYKKEEFNEKIGMNQRQKKRSVRKQELDEKIDSLHIVI